GGQAINLVTPAAVPGALRRTWVIDPVGVGLLTSTDDVYRLTTGQSERLIGERKAELDRLALLDVAALNQDLVIATANGMRNYDGQTRAWGDWFAPPEDTRALELATFGKQLLARTDRGRLTQVGSGARVL